MSQKISTRKMLAIQALLKGLNITEAAMEAHVNRRTLTRWMGDKAFTDALEAAVSDVITAATRKLITLANPAVQVIEFSMANKDSNPGVRLRAAQTVLEFMLRLLDRDVEERLRRLEGALYDEQTTD